MKIYYQRDPGTGFYLLQWSRGEAIGRDFSAFLTENGRHAVVSPPFGRYGEKGWLAVTETKLIAMKEKGPDTKDGRLLEFQEAFPGKRKGETFTASFGSFLPAGCFHAFVADSDPVIASKQAGDFLDEKARSTAAAENISYAAAFNRTCRENPEVYRYYQGS